MPIISVRDDENNRWKRKGKLKRERNKGVVLADQVWNEILGNQCKGFAIKA